tara:strand:- start:2060 stop:2446 length:387 start_codon:yes stop_codon:yes gene_type:complete
MDNVIKNMFIVLCMAIITTPIVFLLTSTLSVAQALDSYCKGRGVLAQQISKSIDEGYPLDMINIAWKVPPANEKMQVKRNLWVTTLKREIVFNKRRNITTERMAERVEQYCIKTGGKTRLNEQLEYDL